MADLAEIQENVLIGLAYMAELAAEDLQRMRDGLDPDPKNVEKEQCILILANALQMQINAGVNDQDTQDIYVQFLNIIGDYNGTFVPIPNVIIPDIVVIVDDASLLTFDNGLTRTGNTVRLGGLLVQHTFVDSIGTYNLIFGNASASILQLLPTAMQLAFSSGGLSKSINMLSTGGILIDDNLNTIGLRYNSNYSINNTGINYNARWIPDQGWNDSAYAPVSGSGNYIHNQKLVIQDGSFSIGNSGHIGGYGLTETFASPTVTGHQGYATDGTYHYLFDTARIDKRNNDGTWSIALSNASPFTGVAEVNHLGDGTYYSGVLYVPAETWTGACGAVSGQKILIFNATTLALINQFDISAQGHEVSSITIDSVNNIAYVSSYCDGSKLWKYNATTFAFIGVLNLELTINHIQGISYENGYIYIASDIDGLFKTHETTGNVIFIKAQDNDWLTPEGIDVIGGQIRWLVDNNGIGTDSTVYYLDANSVPQGFYTDANGISYFGNRLNIGRSISIGTEATIGTINTNVLNPGNSTQMYMLSDTNIAAIGHDNNQTFLTRNAYYNAGWIRPDSLKSALGIFLSTLNNRFEFRTSVADSGLTWLTPIIINASGKITINNATENILDGTGYSATEQTCLVKNMNANAASAYVAVDNGGNRFMSIGILNTTTTLGSQYGLAGEAFLRASTQANGMHISCVTGPLRFSTNGSNEAMRIFQTTRNITIGGTTDAGFKLDIQGTARISNRTGTPVNGLGVDSTGKVVNMGPSILTATVSTTDATLTTLATVPTITGQVYFFTIIVLGKRTGGVSGTAGDVATYTYSGSFRNSSGTLTLMSETGVVSTEQNTTWDVQVSPSGANLLIRVLGAIGNNIDWKASKIEINTL